MRTEGSAKKVTIATLIPRDAAVMDVSPADLARERMWRVQAEAQATVAEERARAAEERAQDAEERAAVSAWLIARLRGEMTGAGPWGDGAGGGPGPGPGARRGRGSNRRREEEKTDGQHCRR